MSKQNDLIEKRKEPFDCRLQETAFTIASSHSHSHTCTVYTFFSASLKRRQELDFTWKLDCSLHLHSAIEGWTRSRERRLLLHFHQSLTYLRLSHFFSFSAPHLSSPCFLRVLQLLFNFYSTFTQLALRLNHVNTLIQLNTVSSSFN